MSLAEAVECFKRDDVIRDALPDEMSKVFIHYKEDEWAKFMATVTEWDIDTYIDCLP